MWYGRQSRGRYPSAMAHTVVSHRDVRHDLLQYRLPFREPLVLGLRCLQLGAELLHIAEYDSYSGTGQRGRYAPVSFLVGRTSHPGRLAQPWWAS